MLITLYCNVDNYVKVLCLLCFVVWISLLCACSADNISDLFVYGVHIVSLCDGHIYDGIVFDVWHVITTFCMFFGVNLG